MSDIAAQSLAGVRVACSWSGGKDSCLALHRAREAGAIPVALLTMFDDDGARSRSHGLRPEILARHADALGIPLLTGRAGWKAYRGEFLRVLAEARALGADDIVFGDIDLEAHRVWEDEVCTEAGARAHLPLWLGDRRALVEEFLAAGFEARITTVRLDALGPEVLGRALDHDFIAHCERLGVDACGENGEFHTVVVNAPWFAHPLELRTGATHEVGGCAGIDFTVS